MFSQLRVAKVLGWKALLNVNKLKRFNRETIRGFYTTRTIIALLNIGFFQELEGQQVIKLEAFAAARNLDLQVLKILCDYLFSLKILSRDSNHYALAPKGQLMVEALSGAFDSVYAYEDIFYHLEPLLRKEMRYGVDIMRRAEYVAKGSGQIGKLLAFPVMIDLLTRNKFRKVLDLGCGDGSFLTHLCENNNHISGYGVDISPEAIRCGRSALAQKDLQDRVQLFPGDIFRIETLIDQLQNIEVATCIYVLHEFLTEDKGRILELFSRFKQAFPGVPLIICEVIRHSAEELRQKPGGLMEIQLFHQLSNQSLLSRAEWAAIFKQAGFRNIEENYINFARTAFYIVS